ncbi:MAG TPA: alpha/beta fold hydrolase [Rhizobacter sp.]|nr:alpha/beta fold hydrolase [Rhizobacter sp.]
MKRLFAAAALLLAAAAASAQPADSPFLPPLEPTGPADAVFTTEAELARWPDWRAIETATLQQAELTRGSFSGADGAKIHYRLYRHRAERRGGIVLVSGRTEGLVLYQELIHDLVRNGYSVYIHDHRGQGFSQRLLADDTSIGYVKEFDHYVSDLAAFISGPVRTARGEGNKPLYLLAHSMGGAISALYLERVPRDGVAAAALVTPMMEPWVASSADAGIATRLVDSYCKQHSRKREGWIGSFLETRYADGAPFDDEYAALRNAWPGANNDLTHSALRFERHWVAQDQARCDGPDCGSPHAKVGGVSFRWLNQSCMATEQARGPAARRIAVPVLLLQGERDTVVKPGAQKQFCDELNAGNGPGYCVGRRLPQARHALFIESDTYRTPALRRALGFFDCVGAGTSRCE